MFGIFRKLIRIVKYSKLKYLLHQSVVTAEAGAVVNIAENTKIINSHIVILKGGRLEIAGNCTLRNIKMIVDGVVTIGSHNTIENGRVPMKEIININKGTLIIGHHNRLRLKMIVRFGGILTIGDYNNINEESEIRADESVSIGSFNQISYKCMIWDTNTHNIYSDEKRRELTIKHFPTYGFEYERPKTSPVSIGDDCWIGREAALLKGTVVKNSSIVGFKAVLVNSIIEERMTVVSKGTNLVFERK